MRETVSNTRLPDGHRLAATVTTFDPSAGCAMKIFLSTVVAVLLIMVLGGIFFIYSGSYDVAATSRDPGIVRWAVRITRINSINRRAEKVVPPAESFLKDPETIRTGFEHYDAMCVVCHGAPGVEAGEARAGLNPRPPLLAEIKGNLPLGVVFRAVKHGIKMTGMPAWGPTHSDDEIWALVAFVDKLTRLSPEDYQGLRQQWRDHGGEVHHEQ